MTRSIADRLFPLALYERDRERAARLREVLGPQRRLPREAVRFVLDHPDVSSALIGFGETWQIDDAVAALDSQADPVNWAELQLELARCPEQV
jgi:aryl-alcohol dehydrogenase-like predicted oxidoreductase